MPLMALAGTVMKQLELPAGTFAVPRLYIPKHSPFYGPARTLFDRLPWGLRRPRSDALENRFNAFCCLLWAAVEDPNWTVSTILNNSHYDISKWPIPYRAMADTVKQRRLPLNAYPCGRQGGGLCQQRVGARKSATSL